VLGRDYDSLDDFKEACKRPRGSLDPLSVLSRVYCIDHLRMIAEFLQIGDPEIPSSSAGLSRRYALAEAIAGASDAEAIGAVLSRADHDFYFPVLTYFCISEGEQYASVPSLLSYLDRQHDISASEQHQAFFNGLTRPPPRSCLLESIYVRDMIGDTVSLVFSCSRCLRVPRGSQDTYEDLFLARIPVIVRVLLRHRLVEVSMPTFCEPSSFTEGTSPLIPYRYQNVFWSARAQLASILPFKLRPIYFSDLALYLETREGARDMGWMIEPQDQAELDLKQGLIPLKDIFDDFSDKLRQEAARRGRSHPLAGIDLYILFRALKEESYTSLCVLDAPLGPRGGSVLMQTLYGRPDTERDPILLVQNYREDVADRLRHAVDQSQTADDLENPYNLDALFPES